MAVLDECSVVRVGSLRTTNSFTTSPECSSGTPTAAHFAHARMHHGITSSTSFGYTLKPDTRIMSFLRSTMFT